MTVRTLLHAILAFVGMTWIAVAASADGFLAGPFDATKSAARTKAARATAADVEALLEFLQAPRPIEAEWVAREQASISNIKNAENEMARSVQLYGSVEFQHLKLYGQTQEIRNALRCAIDSTAARQREMYCWAVASFLLGDNTLFTDAVRILLEGRRLPADLAARIQVGSPDGIALRYGLYSRNIQEYIVIPYLRGDLK